MLFFDWKMIRFVLNLYLVLEIDFWRMEFVIAIGRDHVIA